MERARFWASPRMSLLPQFKLISLTFYWAGLFCFVNIRVSMSNTI